MVRSWLSTAGTVEQAATPSTLVPPSSPRYVSASSSAVSRASVFTRHDSISRDPSKTPSTVLVLPMSTASSTSSAFSEVQGDVEDRRRVGQGTDRDVVDPGRGHLPGRAEGEPAAGLGPGPGRLRDRHRGPH